MAADEESCGEEKVCLPRVLFQLTPAPPERKTPVRWSQGLADRLCARLAAGELLYRILREDGMPTPEGVAKWAKQKPAFGAALTAARIAGGRPPGQRGPVSSYRPDLGTEVFERLCDGDSLTEIGRDPTMPCLSTLQRWREDVAGFDELVIWGKRVQAERYCDVGMEIAAAATPKTAFATAVLLTQLRWTAGVMAPRLFRLKPAEPPGAARTVKIVSRRYAAEIHPETGERRMATYSVIPGTGEVTKTWSEHALRDGGGYRTQAEAAAEGGADDVDAWL